MGGVLLRPFAKCKNAIPMINDTAIAEDSTLN